MTKHGPSEPIFRVYFHRLFKRIVGLTPKQYGYNFTHLAGPQMVNEETPGERIRITGRVLDGEGMPVSDAMLEVWQADAAGNYPAPSRQDGFTGFGRVGTGTDPDNRFWFDTVKLPAKDAP